MKVLASRCVSLLLAAVFSLVTYPSLTCAEPTGIHVLRLVDVEKDLRGLSKLEASVPHDVIYGRPKRYEGYRLESVLALVPGFDPKAKGLVVEFVARDGYRASASLDRLLIGRGVLAVRDLEAPEGRNWIPVAEGREKVDPSPYLLAWEGEAGRDGALPWPHQVVELRIGSPAAIFGASYPAAHPEAEKGFTLFRTNCLSCHSVNLQGGAIGPELNVPKSVTEYWRKDDILALIENPNEYRWGTRMPAFPSLGKEERERIYDYLRAMREEKICGSASECARLKR